MIVASEIHRTNCWTNGIAINALKNHVWVQILRCQTALEELAPKNSPSSPNVLEVEDAVRDSVVVGMGLKGAGDVIL